MYPYGGMPGYYNPYYMHSQLNNVNEENKQLKNQIFSHKEAIGELEEQVDTMAREGTRFEDIIHKYNQDLQTARERYTQPTAYGGGISGVDTANVQTAVSTVDPRRTFRSFGDTADPRKGFFKWADAETDNVLHNIANQEQELLRIISNLPENSAMYKTKSEKLQEVVRKRVELEKMLYNRADYDQYYKEKVIDDQKKDNIAQWLRRDITLFEKEASFQKYRSSEGFLIYWDYILNLLKEFKKVQIVYGIYNRGSTVFEPRLVDLTDINDTTHPNFAQVIFDINHLVRDIEPHPDSLLIFEIQVPVQKTAAVEEKLNAGANTGYRLSTRAREVSKRKFDEFDDFDESAPSMYQTYGWSVIDLYSYKHDLKRGTYKVPIYKPPTIVNLDVRDIPALDRIPDTMVWMRIAFPKEDEYSEIRCDPSVYHIYYIPEIHNFAPKIDMYVKPERDPNYICEGINVFVHFAKGIQAARHVRVATCIQLGKNIIQMENGALCFYATRGIKPEVKEVLTTKAAITPKSKNSAVKSILKKNATVDIPTHTIYHELHEFNDGKEFFMDFYKLFWDEDLNENMYVVIQYLERKEGVIPTVNAVISRKLIEDEYDCLGYSVIQINNPDGTIRYGTYTLDLYNPPIYVEELDETQRTTGICKVTIGRPGIEISAPKAQARQRTPPMPGSTRKVQINTTPQVNSIESNRTPRSRKKRKRKTRPMKEVETPTQNEGPFENPSQPDEEEEKSSDSF